MKVIGTREFFFSVNKLLLVVSTTTNRRVNLQFSEEKQNLQIF